MEKKMRDNERILLIPFNRVNSNGVLYTLEGIEEIPDSVPLYPSESSDSNLECAIGQVKLIIEEDGIYGVPHLFNSEDAETFDASSTAALGKGRVSNGFVNDYNMFSVFLTTNPTVYGELNG